MEYRKSNNLSCPTEHEEVVMFAQYLELLKNKGKVVIFTKICQETFTKSWSQKNKNKSEGLHKGFPDFAIIVKDKFNSHILLFIEMKRTKGGKQDINQKSWEKALNQAGEYYFVCKGFDEAQSLIDKTIKGL